MKTKNNLLQKGYLTNIYQTQIVEEIQINFRSEKRFVAGSNNLFDFVMNFNGSK